MDIIYIIFLISFAVLGFFCGRLVELKETEKVLKLAEEINEAYKKLTGRYIELVKKYCLLNGVGLSSTASGLPSPQGEDLGEKDGAE